MKRARVVAGRTFARLASATSAWFSGAAFVAYAGWRFAHAIRAAEGTTADLQSIWATGAIQAIPFLAALLTMRTIAEDRATGMLKYDLATAVPERSLVMGRFWGAWLFGALFVLAYWLLPCVALPVFAPRTTFLVGTFVPAALGLLIALAVSTAVGILASALTRRPAVSVLVAVALSVGVPYGIRAAAIAWLPAVRATFAEPLAIRFAAAFAFGQISSEHLVLGFGIAFAALFCASKALAWTRFACAGHRLLKASTVLACVLAITFAGVAFATARAFSLTLPIRPSRVTFSARTRQALADMQGDLRITYFSDHDAAAFGRVSRLLRTLSDEARLVSGLSLNVRYVDPRWDLGRAGHLLRKGIAAESVVFEQGHRQIVLAAAEVDEEACVDAIARLAMPDRPEVVYATSGHGESAFDSYDAVTGLSTFARLLRRAGYEPRTLPAGAAVPSDCAVLVMPGVRTPLSAAERAALAAYLNHDGRVLVLGSGFGGEVNSGAELPGGLSVGQVAFRPLRTLTGADYLADPQAGHLVTRSLVGNSLVFGAGAFALRAPNVASNAVASAGDVVHTPLATTPGPEGACVMAAAWERGGAVRSDIAIRPSRLVLVGDPAFAENGALATRAHANGDFLLNTVAWLAGISSSTASGTGADVLTTGMNRAHAMAFLLVSCGGVPLALFAMGFLVVLWRRRA